MSHGLKTWIWIAALLLVGGGGTVLVLWRLHKARPLSLTGALIRKDSDPNKELPIADVTVSASGELAVAASKSDSSGFWSLTLRKGLRRGHPITLKFRHPDYLPLDLNEFTGDRLYIARMVPIPRPVATESNRPQIVVSNIRVRYSMKSTTTVNIGSAVKTFQVENQGDQACKGQHPCSPDGKWKAGLGSTSLDAGEGNEFINARTSCIAGPCPFTRIDTDGFSHGGRHISVSARDWSDTTTFLLEAEVVHSMVSDLVRLSYPVIFGQTLNFTLPAAAEGVSIEAEINRQSIVFPLGPNLFLNWATCNARVNKDQTKVYRCELKPGYRL